MPVYGLNFDPDNPRGLPVQPAAGLRFQELRGLKWARFIFQADPHQPRTIAQSCAFYDPLVNDLNAAGVGVLFILNHQTVLGNTPWLNGNWQAYAGTFAGACDQIAAHFAGRNVAYEIWNEGDQGSASAIGVSPADYALVLRAASHAIKARDAAAPVVLGGLVSGDPVSYLKSLQTALGSALPVDAIGIHPYGKGPTANNSIVTHLARVANAFPALPIWITEIGDGGVLPGNYPVITTYMRGIDRELKNNLPSRVPVLIWYCWSDGMNSSFGVVDNNLAQKGSVYTTFFGLVRAGAALPPLIPAAAPAPGAAPAVPAGFTHQDLINAFFAANAVLGGNVWLWFRDAGLNGIFANRAQVYAGVAIDALPNLTQIQKDYIKFALANQPLPAAPAAPPPPPPAGVPAPMAASKLLEVAWVSQMDANGFGNNDCGDAAVLMLLQYYNRPTPSREVVFSQFSGKTGSDDLIALAGKYDLSLMSRTGNRSALITRIRDLLDQNKPVIPLVNYADLQFAVHLTSGVDQGLHWFVIVGYDSEGFIVHDPLWRPTQREGKGGAYLSIQTATLEHALRGTVLFAA